MSKTRRAAKTPPFAMQREGFLWAYGSNYLNTILTIANKYFAKDWIDVVLVKKSKES